MTTAFEWDLAKSAGNAAKHGIDFETAKQLWLDPRLLEFPARTSDEPRWFVVGILNGKHWSAIFTRRENVVRLISVRRSRKEEIDLYES
jgi:uncharacterized protein